MSALDLGVVHALTRVTAPHGVDVGALLPQLGGFFHAEGMYRDVLGAQGHNAVKGGREGLEAVPGESRDEIGVDHGDARGAGNLIGLVEHLGIVGAADVAQHVITQSLGIDADTPHAILSGHSELFRGDGIGSARFQRILLQGADIGHALHGPQQEGQLIGIQNGGGPTAHVDGTHPQTQAVDGLKGLLQIVDEPLEVLGNEGQKPLGGIGHEGAVGTAGGAEGDGDVDRAVPSPGGADEPRLVDGHVGGEGGLLGDDEVILGQLLADAGLAHALL